MSNPAHPGSETLFRRSRHVVCYWLRGHMMFENYATGARMGADPVTARVLHSFDDWRPASALGSVMPGYSLPSLRKAVTELARRSFLERSDQPAKAERRMETWGGWNPAAGFFHLSTKDAPFARDQEDVERRLLRKARRTPMPEPLKRYPGAGRIALPPPAVEGDVPRLLLARRTWRRFSRRPLGLPALATLLGLTWRVQRWIDLPGLGRVALKTSPSGGARHSIEAYVLARRVDGLEAGLYHYAPDRHALERVKRGASSRQIRDYLPGQWWFRNAPALVLMTSVFERMQWRYDYARVYRAVQIEAGHLCQTFCLVATWLGLAPFCTLALADSRIEKDLGIDGVTESVLYAAGVGIRPAGVEWAPWPGRRPREL